MDKNNDRRKKEKMTFEQIVDSITKIGREEVTRRIMNYRGSFKMDFSNDYLNKLPVDRLKHIYLAALINNPNSSNLKHKLD